MTEITAPNVYVFLSMIRTVLWFGPPIMLIRPAASMLVLVLMSLCVAQGLKLGSFTWFWMISQAAFSHPTYIAWTWCWIELGLLIGTTFYVWRSGYPARTAAPAGSHDVA